MAEELIPILQRQKTPWQLYPSYEKIFTEFYRVKQARLDGVAGSGLGLYIVKSIVSAHGGTIWGESAIGQGSTFFFTMRRAPEVDGPGFSPSTS